MPFTPFHLGPGAVFKWIGGRHFSFTLFGFSQVLIDVEPLIHMIRGDAILHGPTHTYLGALLLTPIAVVVGRPICNGLLRYWNYGLNSSSSWRILPIPIPWKAAWIGALVGMLSHILLDSIMHMDMRPWMPLSISNFMFHIINVDNLHIFCTVSGIVALAGMSFGILRQNKTSDKIS